MAMRLLLDENISWCLAAYLLPHCAMILHVQGIQLDSSPGTSIWRYAQQVVGSSTMMRRGLPGST